MDLIKAFRLPRDTRIAIVGAGGKSRLLYHLAWAYQQDGVSPLVTTTTHLSLLEAAAADQHLITKGPTDLSQFQERPPTGVVCITGPPFDEVRLSSPDSETFIAIVAVADRWKIPVLIEADGSRRRPLKAPGSHEPVIPGFADQVIVVAGLLGIGHQINAEIVHRPELYARLAGVNPGDRITPEIVADVLNHAEGGLKGIPGTANRIAFLNCPDDPELRAQAGTIADRLVGGYSMVVTGVLKGSTDSEESWAFGRGLTSVNLFSVHEPIAGVVLAAGGSNRFPGHVKQLLNWRGEPLIRHVIRSAIDGGLDPIVVVTGESSGEIKQAIVDMPVAIVHNPDWQAGQSSSLRRGVYALPTQVGAAVFLLADQPQVPGSLIRSLVETHQRTRAAIVAPLVNGQRGNPVLFDRDTFLQMEDIQGDVGGRALFSEFKVEWVPWHDEGILFDIDTVEDYQRFLAHFG